MQSHFKYGLWSPHTSHWDSLRSVCVTQSHFKSGLGRARTQLWDTASVWSQTFYVDLPDPLTLCLLTCYSSVPFPVLPRSSSSPSQRSSVPSGSPGKRKGHLLTDKPHREILFPACSPGYCALLVPLHFIQINLWIIALTSVAIC